MRYSYIGVVFGAVILLAADLWLKSKALGGTVIDLPIGQFILFKNYGIIFSWPLRNVLAVVLMLGALAVVIWLLVGSWRQQDLKKISAGMLLLIGAASNIYDRLLLGYIVDWAYLGQWWPVFNLADVYIATGLIMYLTPTLIPKD